MQSCGFFFPDIYKYIKKRVWRWLILGALEGNAAITITTTVGGGNKGAVFGRSSCDLKKKRKKKKLSDRGCSKVEGRGGVVGGGGGGGSVEEIKSIETEVEAGVVTSLLHIEPVVESSSAEIDRGVPE